MRNLLLTVASLSLAAAALGCGLDCTEIGCFNAVSIQVREADGAAAQVRTATVTMADRSEAVVRCEGDGGVQSASASGRFLPSLGGCVGDRIFLPVGGDVPERVEVRLETRSGARFEGSITLARDTINPNGPGCGPGCRQGAAEVRASGR